MPTNLVVCESPWIDERRNLERWSMRPFVEGLAELHDARLVYRTFTTAEELKDLIGYQAIDKPRQRTIVYIACHGRGGRLLAGREERPVNLASIAECLSPGVEGAWIGACDVGRASALSGFLKWQGGAVWAGGYACAVDWEPSLQIDLAVLQALLRRSAVRSRDQIITAVATALRPFNPNWTIGVDSRNEKTPLKTAIRVVARDRIQGSRPLDVTTRVTDRLRWTKNGGAR